MERDKKIVSIDWCDDQETGYIPGDDEQFVTVRRLTGREKRQRQAIASGKMAFDITDLKSNSKNVEPDAMSIDVQLDKLKKFEWEQSIVNFKLRNNRGGFETYSEKDANRNARIYDHIDSGSACGQLIDSLIAKVNKEDSEGHAELEEVVENSESSSVNPTAMSEVKAKASKVN